MAVKYYNAFFGLATNPNPLSGVPQGALKEAANVVIRRPGVVQPRPGFTENSDFSSTASHVIKQIIPFDGELFLVQENSGSWLFTRLSDDQDFTGTLDFTATNIHSAEAGKNLYVTSDRGVLRIENASSDTSLGNAGVPEAPTPIYTHTSTGFLANGQYAGVQLVFKKTINGRELLGKPSTFLVLGNTTGSSKAIQAQFALPDDIVAGDTYQFYATETRTDPDLARQLSATLIQETEITSSDVSSGEITVTLSTPATGEGAVIYTDATQEGATAANLRPPGAKDVELFQDMLFYANVIERGNATARYVVGNGFSSSVSDQLIGANSAGVTSLTTSLAGKVNAYITEDSANPATATDTFAARTKITAVANGNFDITIDQATLDATTNGQIVDIWPVITINGRDYYGYTANNATNRSFVLGSGTAFSSHPYESNGMQTLANLSYVVGADSGQSDFYVFFEAADPDAIVFRIERRLPLATDFTLQISSDFTDGSDFTPPYDSSTAIEVESFKNRLYYSKSGEYEAVPALNFINLGSQTQDILRILAIDDQLFCFTTAGLFMVYGTSPVDISTQEGPQTLDLLNPNALVRLDESLYAFTSQGFVAVGPAGIRPLSDQTIDDQIQSIVRTLRPNPNAEGVWAAAKQTEDLILFGIPSDAAQTDCEKIYVYSVRSNGWTTWDLQKSAGALNLADEKLYLGTTESLVEERLDTPADESYSVTVVGNSSGRITISAGSGWTPEVGDAIVEGNSTAIITEVISSTVFETIIDTGGISLGAATGYKSFTCTVAPTVDPVDSPALGNHHRDVIVDFQDRKFLGSVQVGHTTDRQRTEVSSTLTETTLPAAAYPESLRLSIPRAARRARQLFPKVTIRNALSNFSLTGLTLIFEPIANPKSNRR